MSEISLFNHNRSLEDATAMPDNQLVMRVSDVEGIETEAQIHKIERQAVLAKRVLLSYRFEQLMRETDEGHKNRENVLSSLKNGQSVKDVLDGKVAIEGESLLEASLFVEAPASV